jgi:hypothetical protein
MRAAFRPAFDMHVGCYLLVCLFSWIVRFVFALLRACVRACVLSW